MANVVYDEHAGIQVDQYAIIAFLPKKDGCPLEIDLIPSSWINYDGGKIVCSYPNTKKDLKKRDEFLENLSPPKERWPHFEIEIISTTDTLERGRRRLKRAEMTRNVETETGSDTGSKNQQDSDLSNVFILQNDDIIDELNHVESMSSIACQSTDACSEKNKHAKSFKVKEVHSTFEGETGNHQAISTYINYDDILFDRIKTYIDGKFDELHEHLDAFKISTEYVIKNEAKRIKTQVLMKTGENVPNISKTTAMEPYKNIFPINDEAQFLIFDNDLKTDDEKKKLKNLFRVMYGESDVVTIIRKNLSEVITPTVQLNYSGTGKKVRGIGKHNFSATCTYTCLKEVVEEKFRDSDQSKSLRVKIGSFLTNAGDRDGGRRQRAINNQQQQQDNNNNNKNNNNNNEDNSDN